MSYRLYCRLAGWIGVFAYSYGLGHGLMHARDGWTGMASGVEVISCWSKS